MVYASSDRRPLNVSRGNLSMMVALYMKATNKEHKIIYPDGTSHYITIDDFGGVQVIPL